MKINALDNVIVDLKSGHKYADRDIAEGENIIKYGFPIGHATKDIKSGEHVHTHNCKTNLSDKQEYTYKEYTAEKKEKPQEDLKFMGYIREDGRVGIRNDIWVINTVGCVNQLAKRLCEETGAFYFPHPFGCSQLGDDFETTQKVLCGLIKHPNAGGVLVLGLGCENNNIESLKKVLGEVNPDRVKFLVAQECEDEIAEGIALIEQLKKNAEKDERVEVPVSSLVIGLKCGGSDGLSGITANPLVGAVSDMFVENGATSVLTEVPEMFGAEHILMERAKDRETFEKIVSLINDFKDYYISHNQVVYENPSPGNKAGGITTLEEKSLGCVQKGGRSVVTDVMTYGDTANKNGLLLLNGPGNDGVAITNLTAAGANLILFTTGRGTPLGAPVPTLKISTNKNLSSKKGNWIDFDASVVLEDGEMNTAAKALFDLCIETANGKLSKNEEHGYREISIFKDGVTL